MLSDCAFCGATDSTTCTFRADSRDCVRPAARFQARAVGCRRMLAADAGARGILSLTPGTPEHAARVAQRSCTDAERDGL